MSDTPRTDELDDAVAGAPWSIAGPMYRDHARQLERENARLREALTKVTRHNTAGLSDEFQDDVFDARAMLSASPSPQTETK